MLENVLDNLFIVPCLFSEIYAFVELGMTAPQAAGVIHSDFEKGFIRAETVSLISYWNIDLFIV